MPFFRRLRWHLVTVSLLVAPMAACAKNSESLPDHDSKPVAASMCASSDKKDGIERCREVFPGKEPIRLPADPSSTRKYGALVRGGKAFHTRTGDLPIAPTVLQQLQSGATAGHAPYANTIYLATVAQGSVTDIKPIAVIDENALLKFFFAGRSMEGTIDSLVAPGQYGDARRFRIRIEFAHDPISGTLKGKFVNADAAVRGADGTCIEALPRLGNPFTGPYTANIQIQRFPGMHAPFDDEMLIVWDDNVSNMGSEFYPSIATLLGGDTLGQEWKTVIHGTPSAGPAVDVHLVGEGGGAC
ncbi:MAG TPA: hypothetical protein VI248_28440 [Kineosporiaceae bacterium]